MRSEVLILLERRDSTNQIRTCLCTCQDEQKVRHRTATLPYARCDRLFIEHWSNLSVEKFHARIEVVAKTADRNPPDWKACQNYIKSLRPLFMGCVLRKSTPLPIQAVHTANIVIPVQIFHEISRVYVGSQIKYQYL